MDTTTIPETEQDIRMRAWAFGHRCEGSLATAYRRLENNDGDAKAVFAALARNEWGVQAAFVDGLRGVAIEVLDPTTGITLALVPEPGWG